MKNELNELRDAIDKLSIQVALNLCHIRNLEKGLMELGNHLLDDSEARKFGQEYYRTLYDETSRRMNQFADAGNFASVQFELLELKGYVSQKLQQLVDGD